MSRYSVVRNPKHSIDYTIHPVFAPVKMLCGHIAIDYYNKNEINGWYGEINKRRLVERISDQMPCVPKLFKELHRGKENIGTTFSKRGAFCIPSTQYDQGKNELVALKHMAVTYEGVEDLFLNDSKVCCEEQLMEWQEKIILMTCEPGPCVYLRTNFRIPDIVYLGETGEPTKRNSGHSNSPLYLSKLWTVSNRRIAKAIQDHGLDYLENECKYTKTKEGWFRTKWDNAGEWMEQWMESNYGHFFYNRGEITHD
jgi:hypothetical protein